MQYRNLGNTGLEVSRLCLGTMTFGLQTEEQTAIAIMDRALEGGVTFFDTADVYPVGGTLETVGQTEAIVGRWLKSHRDEVIVATKAVGAMGPRGFQQGASYKHIVEAVDASLRRLHTDHIDLYQLHSYDPTTPIEEVAFALDQLVHSGKVLYVGVSNYAAYQVARLLGKADAKNRVRISSVQPRYNLVWRDIERDLLPLSLEEGLGVIPYNPLAGGLLTGKHRGAVEPTPGSRFTLGTAAQRYQERYWNKDIFETVEALRPLASQLNTTLATLSVAWVLQHPAITSAIIGASRVEQLEATLAAADLTIPTDVAAEIDLLTMRYRWWDIP
ncbi:MAG: aldo/keto reductase [Ferrimicrobium sp.]